MGFPLNAQFARGTSFAGRVVLAAFLESARVAMLLSVFVWRIYAVGACLDSTFIFELHFDLVGLVEDVVVEGGQRVVLLFFGVERGRGEVLLLK